MSANLNTPSIARGPLRAADVERRIAEREMLLARHPADWAIHTEPRNERQAHACMADACEQGRRKCPCPDACEVAEPGSVELPNWLLYLLLAVTLVAVLFFAPGVWQ